MGFCRLDLTCKTPFSIIAIQSEKDRIDPMKVIGGMYGKSKKIYSPS